jgi:MoxR-like ATPase
MTSNKSTVSKTILPAIGIYGYEDIEPPILASLVTADPLLLIGECGTGKTFLLNKLSEILGLEHRHYNASLISFDDLVGFPYPAKDFTEIKYLETPATVWHAESIFVDEISRCKPEHQNRFFSLIQEKRIQGIKIENLRYRWAAMNPCGGPDQGKQDSYTGSEPLDQALADRFAFVVEVPDWSDLKDKARQAVAGAGIGQITIETADRIKSSLEKWQIDYHQFLKNPCQKVVDYCCAAATELGAAGLRISPRRVRQLVKNIGAIQAIRGNWSEEKTFLSALKWSLPQRAWGAGPANETVRAIHRSAWDSVSLSGKEKWLNRFHLERKLSGKIKRLVSSCPDPDTGTLALTQLLANEPKERAALFAYALYPAAIKGMIPIGTEGISELAKTANLVHSVDGAVSWRGRPSQHHKENPEFMRLGKALSPLSGKRRERAGQFFNYLLVEDISVASPQALEEELERCVQHLQSLNL